MQPLKITIYGDFWDCQIYMGQLYLWTFDGRLQIYDWDALVMSFLEKEEEAIALRYAFTNGNYLYGENLQIMNRDSEFKTLLLKRFENLSNRNLAIETSKPSIETNNPFAELQTDSDIVNHTLYGITDNGLFSIDTNGSKNKVNKIFDSPFLSIKASKYHKKLALSAGDEGLFQYDIQGTKPVEQVDKRHSLFANWAGQNIYSSSNVGEDYMVMLGEEKPALNNMGFIATEKEIFKTNENTNREPTAELGCNEKKYLSWASSGKVFRAKEDGIEIVNEVQKGTKVTFSDVKFIPIKTYHKKVIGGGTAYFGTIVEYNDALIVALSNGEVYPIEGDITRWRVYPRSINYENQLHVIFDDRIEIYSFNHDYFVNQRIKNFGMAYEARHYIQNIAY
ncbi:MAG: hypothetical protein JNM36_05575 [Chitinophagales bacterium]|jgi:hypothetical protein|nr:hypothetical protein [Chitinophagales bacterium]